MLKEGLRSFSRKKNNKREEGDVKPRVRDKDLPMHRIYRYEKRS